MIARRVSILFHPFVTVGVMAGVAPASRQSAGGGTIFGAAASAAIYHL